MNLKEKALSGVKWTTLSTVIIGILSPLFLLVQSFFFIPEEYAYISLISVFISLFKVIEDAGISQSIIRKDANQNQLSSLLIFNIVLSILFFLIIFIISDYFNVLFKLDELGAYIRYVSLIILIVGPSMIYRALLQKDMYFLIISSIEMVRVIVLVVVGTVLFIFNFGIFGFIAGHLISSFVSLVLYIYFGVKKTKFVAKLYFSFSEIKSFLSFGIYIALKNILAEVTHNIDKVIIGIFLSKEILGIYSYAKQLIEQVRVLITTTFSRVLFSLFAKIKNNLLLLKNTYLNISKYVGFIVLPIFIGIIISAKEFVPIIFGVEWIDTVIYFQVLSIPIMLLSLTAGISNSLLYALGDSKTSFKIDLLSSFLYIIALFIFSKYGGISVAIVYSFYILFKVVILQLVSLKSINTSIFKYLYDVFAKNMIPVILMIILYLFTSYLFNADSIFSLLVSITVAAITYLFSTYIFNRNILIDIFKTFRINI